MNAHFSPPRELSRSNLTWCHKPPPAPHTASLHKGGGKCWLVKKGSLFFLFLPPISSPLKQAHSSLANQAVWEPSVPLLLTALHFTSFVAWWKWGPVCSRLSSHCAGTCKATLLNKYLSHHRHPKPLLLWFRLHRRPVWFYTEIKQLQISLLPSLFVFFKRSTGCIWSKTSFFLVTGNSLIQGLQSLTWSVRLSIALIAFAFYRDQVL